MLTRVSEKTRKGYSQKSVHTRQQKVRNHRQEARSSSDCCWVEGKGIHVGKETRMEVISCQTQGGERGLGNAPPLQQGAHGSRSGLSTSRFLRADSQPFLEATGSEWEGAEPGHPCPFPDQVSSPQPQFLAPELPLGAQQDWPGQGAGKA